MLGVSVGNGALSARQECWAIPVGNGLDRSALLDSAQPSEL